MSNRELSKTADYVVKIILFIISPFVAFLFSLKDIKLKSSYVVFFLVCVLFGLYFTVDPYGTNDAVRYYEFFELNKYNTYATYLEGFKEYLSFTSYKKDYYLDTAVFIVSRFTLNYHVLFAFFAVVFSFFYLKSMRFLTKEFKFDTSIASYLLVFLFTISNPIFNINGVRFWTAAWVAVYSVFQIFKSGNKWYILLAFITPFIHVAYWFFVGIVLISIFFRKYSKAWIILFVISFFVSQFAFDLLDAVQSSLPPFLQNLISAYTAAEYVQERASVIEEVGIIKRIFQIMTLVYINSFVFLFIKEKREIIDSNKTRELFLFLLVYMTLINFMMVIPSLGGRYIMLAYPLIAYIWLISFKDVKYKWMLYIMPIVLLLPTYNVFLNTTKVLDINFYFSNIFSLAYPSLF